MRDTIELAREAGDDWDSTLSTDKEFLKRFEALVRADERDLAALVHPVARIESVNETDSAYAYADGWNACVEHHKYIAKNAPEKGQP